MKTNYAHSIKTDFEIALSRADLEARTLPGFHDDLLNSMIVEHGGWLAAKLILQPLPEGFVRTSFARLAGLQRLDLTVEFITCFAWRELFAENDLVEGRKRLAATGYRLSDYVSRKSRLAMIQAI